MIERSTVARDRSSSVAVPSAGKRQKSFQPHRSRHGSSGVQSKGQSPGSDPISPSPWTELWTSDRKKSRHRQGTAARTQSAPGALKRSAARGEHRAHQRESRTGGHRVGRLVHSIEQCGTIFVHADSKIEFVIADRTNALLVGLDTRCQISRRPRTNLSQALSRMVAWE